MEDTVSPFPSQLSFSRITTNKDYRYPQAVSNLANRIDGLLFIKQSETIEFGNTRLDMEPFGKDWIKKLEEYRKKYRKICK